MRRLETPRDGVRTQSVGELPWVDRHEKVAKKAAPKSPQVSRQAGWWNLALGYSREPEAI